MEDHLDDVVIEEKQAPGWKRFLVGWIDAIIVMGSVYGAMVFYYSFAERPQELPNLTVTVFAAFIVYRFVMIYFLDVTIGMFLLKIKILNGEEKKLTQKQRLFAALFVLIEGSNYYAKK